MLQSVKNFFIRYRTRTMQGERTFYNFGCFTNALTILYQWIAQRRKIEPPEFFLMLFKNNQQMVDITDPID